MSETQQTTNACTASREAEETAPCACHTHIHRLGNAGREDIYIVGGMGKRRREKKQ